MMYVKCVTCGLNEVEISIRAISLLCEYGNPSNTFYKKPASQVTESGLFVLTLIAIVKKRTQGNINL